MAYWLIKSEPVTYGIDHMARDKKTWWNGVRNYQARNLMRDQMQVGDGVLFYHSSAEPTGVAGIAEIASGARPDATQFDPADDHYDAASRREDPRWFGVEVRATERLPRFVTLEELRADAALRGMAVLQRGNRLSITPVRESEWRRVREMAGLAKPARRSRA